MLGSCPCSHSFDRSMASSPGSKIGYMDTPFRVIATAPAPESICSQTRKKSKKDRWRARKRSQSASPSAWQARRRRSSAASARRASPFLFRQKKRKRKEVLTIGFGLCDHGIERNAIGITLRIPQADRIVARLHATTRRLRDLSKVHLVIRPGVRPHHQVVVRAICRGDVVPDERRVHVALRVLVGGRGHTDLAVGYRSVDTACCAAAAAATAAFAFLSYLMTGPTPTPLVLVRLVRFEPLDSVCKTPR